MVGICVELGAKGLACLSLFVVVSYTCRSGRVPRSNLSHRSSSQSPIIPVAERERLAPFTKPLPQTPVAGVEVQSMNRRYVFYGTASPLHVGTYEPNPRKACPIPATGVQRKLAYLQFLRNRHEEGQARGLIHSRLDDDRKFSPGLWDLRAGLLTRLCEVLSSNAEGLKSR